MGTIGTLISEIHISVQIVLNVIVKDWTRYRESC